MKTGQKSRIADEVIDRARVQVSFFLPFFFFLSPCSLYRSPFPSLSYVQTDATTCNRLCKRTQNVTSSHPTMLCAFARGLRACLHWVGGPQVGEVTLLSIWSLILIWSRLHDRWGDPPRRVALSAGVKFCHVNVQGAVTRLVGVLIVIHPIRAKFTLAVVCIIIEGKNRKPKHWRLQQVSLEEH